MAKRSDWKLLALKGAGVLAGAGVTGVSAWLLYSRFLVDHKRALPNAIRARRREAATGESGRISHYEDLTATGTPLVLLHSVNAAASAYEVRPLFDQCRDRRPVFAPDLPGFGFSDRENRAYSPEFYTDTLASWIESEVYRGAPVDIVALSLTAEFAARIALLHPNLVRSLVLISPTGFDEDHAAASARAAERVRKTLAVPLWSQAFFDALVTKPSIRHYLKKAFAGPVDEGLAQYCYETSHQPGARYAPLYFVAGRLFTPDVLDSIYARLQLPALVICDDEDDYVSFDRLPAFVEHHGNWCFVRVPGAKSMPHFERPQVVAEHVNSFWTALDRKADVVRSESGTRV